MLTYEERRELLDMAAFASGIKGLSISKGWAVHADLGKPLLSHWNPLEEDGDALRVAVACCLPLDITDEATLIVPLGITEPHGDDPYAATRLAIVRAAAEMGRKMRAGERAICKHCGWPHINDTESCDEATARERGKEC